MSDGEHFTYPSSDGKTMIHAICWRPEGKVQGVLQIVHGMQEFIDRYDSFARFMAEHGFVVVGNDHLGHGGSVRSEKYFGYFAQKDGNGCVLQDIRCLQELTQEKYPDIPYIMLGHSMGSFLCRQYLCRNGDTLSGAVISGTAFHPGPECDMGLLLCRLLARFKGWMYRSRLITWISMGAYNKKIRPLRTDKDWLTRDEAVVNAYIADRRTQDNFTLNGYLGLFTALKDLTRRKMLEQMPKKLPILFIAGEEDPVGAYGAGVKKVVQQFEKLGMENVKMILYPHDRHEVLNELDRETVFQDVYDWIVGVIS